MVVRGGCETEGAVYQFDDVFEGGPADLDHQEEVVLLADVGPSVRHVYAFADRQGHALAYDVVDWKSNVANGFFYWYHYLRFLSPRKRSKNARILEWLPNLYREWPFWCWQKVWTRDTTGPWIWIFAPRKRALSLSTCASSRTCVCVCRKCHICSPFYRIYNRSRCFRGCFPTATTSVRVCFPILSCILVCIAKWQNSKG